MSTKLHTKSYSNNDRLFFLLNPNEDIAENDPVRVVDAIVESVDLKEFKKLYREKGRCPYNPKMMLKIIIYAYMNNIYSCRGIERQVRRDIHYIWLAAQERPDYVTINRFRNRVKNEINNIFTQIVLLLSERGFISLDVEYIDGTKIESRANRYTFVWRKTVEKNRARLQEKIHALLGQIDDAIARDKAAGTEKVEFTPETLTTLIGELKESLASEPEPADMALKPESSHNVNLNLSYNATFGNNIIYVEAGFIYRDTRDYIQRNILALSGGKSAATYVNYGKVDTKGFSISARYNFSKWLSLGGNFTQMNVRDNMKTAMGSTVANVAYRERMPNLPYMFADSDINFYWHGLGAKRNVLTVTYDNQYTHKFCYYASNIGSNNNDYMVPNQFSHNLTISYGIKNGRYNLSFECRNFTNERLYDNFSLQKAGRAFYGKVRIYFGN